MYPMCFAATILKVVTSTLGVLSGENRETECYGCTLPKMKDQWVVNLLLLTDF